MQVGLGHKMEQQAETYYNVKLPGLDMESLYKK